MISLDQVNLLEKKVESAVVKIQQLEAENDALRRQCSELTNALSSKTEQLKTFSLDESQIEEGIKKALDRLNSIENSVLKTAGQSASSTPLTVVNSIQQSQPKTASEEPVYKTTQSPVINNPQKILEEHTEEPVVSKTPSVNEEVLKPDFSTMNPLKSQTELDLESQFSAINEPALNEEENSEDNSDDLGFDIF